MPTTTTEPRPVPPPSLAREPQTDRQREILDAMEHLILAEGFGHLTVALLAQRLSCSRRTLYELAPSKDELVLVVLDRMQQRTGRLARDRLRTVEDPITRLRAFLDAGISPLRAATLRFAEDVAAHPAARRLMDAHYRYAVDVLRSILQDGVKQGAMRPINAFLAAETADAAIARMQDPDVLRAVGVSEADAIDAFADILLHGIVPRPAAARRRARRGR